MAIRMVVYVMHELGLHVILYVFPSLMSKRIIEDTDRGSRDGCSCYVTWCQYFILLHQWYILHCIEGTVSYLHRCYTIL